jgi:hypothetical protein
MFRLTSNKQQTGRQAWQAGSTLCAWLGVCTTLCACCSSMSLRRNVAQGGTGIVGLVLEGGYCRD